MRTHLILLLASLLVSLPSLRAQINFEDISATAGIDSVGTARGISWADYDNDGDQDVYISYSLNYPNLMFRNNGDLTFTNVSGETGLGLEGFGNSSCWGDYDNDGWLDVYVGMMGEANHLFHNNGDGTFTDLTEEYNVGDTNNSRSVHWVDVNHDGWIDLYVHNINADNKLYLNLAGTGFQDNTTAAGANDTLVAQGALPFDYDNDGDTDLYLVHDANQTNILYQNDGTGNFVDVAEETGLDFAANGMGVDMADINNDGWFDVYVTNLGVNGLFIYKPDISEYEFETFDAGPEGNGMSWGTFFFDANNDGFEEIFVCNDAFFSPFPNYLYQNNADGTFTPVLEEHPICGFEASWGGATADLNEDGLPDVFLATANSIGNQLFLNTSENTGNWVGFKLEGTVSNRSAIGSRITVFTEGMQRMDEIVAGSGWASQHSLWPTFGIGEQTQIDSVQVRWPTGVIETAYNVPLGQYHTYVEGSMNPPLEDPFDTLDEGQVDPSSEHEVKDEEESVGLGNDSSAALQLFPNPGRDRFLLSGIRGSGEVTLFSLTGERLGVQTGQNTMTWNTVDLPAGVYLVEVKDARGRRVLRWVKS